MYSVAGDRASPLPGFPIGRSTDQCSLGSSPWLIAACYVLHRLLAPRHPPCTLHCLTTHSFRIFVRMGRSERCSHTLQALVLRTLALTCLYSDFNEQTLPCGKRYGKGAWRVLSTVVRCRISSPVTLRRILVIPRKEVIQPQVLLRLPCYDLVPVTGLTVDRSLLAVGSRALGTPGFRGLTGGVYKAQEHIHRGMLIRDY